MFKIMTTKIVLITLSDFPGMKIQRARDMGHSKEEAVRYLLQWETLGPNRDRPRKPPLPEPSMLRLYKLSAPAKGSGIF